MDISFKTESGRFNYRHFISTNTSSFHIKQLAKNNKACLYYSADKAFEGLCLYGKAILHYEKEYKEYFWHNGDERYYPNGIDDDDYCILEFQAEYGEYYNNMKKPRITLEDITENTLALDIAPFPYN